MSSVFSSFFRNNGSLVVARRLQYQLLLHIAAAGLYLLMDLVFFEVRLRSVTVTITGRPYLYLTTAFSKKLRGGQVNSKHQDGIIFLLATPLPIVLR